MALLARTRSARIIAVGTLLLMGVACSDDKKSVSDDLGDSGEGPTPGEPDQDSGTLRMDASLPMLDARIPALPTSDAGDAGVLLFADGGGAPVVPTPVSPDASLPDPAALTPLPADGNRGSICYRDSECKTDDLTCYLPQSGIPGACVDDCVQDSDCPASGGVAARCNTVTDQCEFGCAGADNKGDGACPDKMVCVYEGIGGLLEPDLWRCRYPAGGGKKTAKKWEACDPAHNDGDCVGTDLCHQPIASIASALLPRGYCINECESDTDCKAPEGIKSKPTCSLITGRCELDCSVPGGNCPADMNCIGIDPTIFSNTNRCMFID
jgi:hypothetical protein